MTPRYAAEIRHPKQAEVLMAAQKTAQYDAGKAVSMLLSRNALHNRLSLWKSGQHPDYIPGVAGCAASQGFFGPARWTEEPMVLLVPGFHSLSSVRFSGQFLTRSCGTEMFCGTEQLQPWFPS